MTIRSYQLLVQALVVPSGGTEVTRSVTHGSVVTQEVEGAVNAEYTSNTDDLGLVDFAVWDLLPGGINNVESELGLQQDIDIFGFKYPESELALDGTAVAQFPIERTCRNDLFMAQAVDFRYFVRNFTLEQELDLSDQANKVEEISVESVLNLDGAGDYLFVESELELVGTAEWGYGFDVESDLNLNTPVDKDQLIGRVLEDTEIVQQAVAWYVEDRCARYQFKSFHGEGGVAPRVRNLNYANTFLLYSQKDGEVLELRNPTTDNRRRYSYNRVNRSFFDGTLDLFTDENSVTEQRQIYTIVANKREKLDALHAFMLNNLGLEVWLKDWKGVTWNVVILNPGEVYTEDGEGYWTIDFEVVGEQYDGEPVFQNLGVTDTPSRAGSIYLRSGTGALALTDRANVEFNIDAGPDDVSLSGAASFTVETP